MVSVGVIGPLRVLRGGHVLAGPDLGSRKARQLVAVLAVEDHRVVSLDRIVDALWHDQPPRRPAADVATLVSRLRTKLGRDAIAGGRTGYRLGEVAGVDLYDAAKLVTAAEAAASGPDAAGALESARHAMRLLNSGGVLDDVNGAEWADPARDLHTVLLRRARHAVADAALRRGDSGAARDAAEAALRADRYDEIGCRLLMRAHRAAGEPAQALIAYERLRRAVAADLGVDPAPQTRDLHMAILHSDARAAPPAARAPAVAGQPGGELVGREADPALAGDVWNQALAGSPQLLLLAVIDDVHSDTATLELLRYLRRRDPG